MPVSKHANLQAKVDKLHMLKIVTSCKSEALLHDVCCDTNSTSCMYSECQQCEGKNVDFQMTNAPDDSMTVVWSEWVNEKKSYEKDGIIKTAKMTHKKLQHETVADLKSKVNEEVHGAFSKHVYNIRHQFRAYRNLKNSLEQHEVVIHVDFSENYSCRYFSEVQACNFGASNCQATLHTGILYTADGHVSFVTISSCLRHDAAAVWAYLRPVLQQLRETHPLVTMLHFFSDGPTTQYRNKDNFYFLSTETHALGFDAATWNFFESGHGKGAPDAIGGALKRKADCMLNAGYDSQDAKKLYDRRPVQRFLCSNNMSGCQQ